MWLGRVEHYTIEQSPDGIRIVVDPARNVLRFAAVNTVVGASVLLLYGFFGSWLLASQPAVTRVVAWTLGGLWCLTELAALSYREICLISFEAVRWSNTWRRKEAEIPRTQIAKWRLVRKSRSDENAYRLYLIAKDGTWGSWPFEFTDRISTEQFLKILQPFFSLHVEAASI